MLELFGQAYMYFLLFMGISIGIGFVVLGYGLKGFLAGAFFTIALGMMSFTIAVILLLVFVNVVLKSVSSKANKILIPLLIIGIVVDIFRYSDKTEETKPKSDEKDEYEFSEETNRNEDIVISNQENEVASNTDYTNDTIESTEEDTLETQNVQGDLDSVPVLGASNTVESARDQIGYLMMYYLQAYADGDTSSLEYYVHPSTDFYGEQVKYMNSLNERGVILDLIEYEPISMEQIADKTYKVTIKEYYTIDSPEKGFSDSEQTSEYTVELIDGEFYITGLVL